MNVIPLFRAQRAANDPSMQPARSRAQAIALARLHCGAPGHPRSPRPLTAARRRALALAARLAASAGR